MELLPGASVVNCVNVMWALWLLYEDCGEQADAILQHALSMLPQFSLVQCTRLLQSCGKLHIATEETCHVLMSRVLELRPDWTVACAA